MRILDVSVLIGRPLGAQQTRHQMTSWPQAIGRWPLPIPATGQRKGVEQIPELVNENTKTSANNATAECLGFLKMRVARSHSICYVGGAQETPDGFDPK